MSLGEIVHGMRKGHLQRAALLRDLGRRLQRSLNVVPFWGYFSFLFWDTNHNISHPIKGTTFKSPGIAVCHTPL